jgi:putative ABC transport system permease protein
MGKVTLRGLLARKLRSALTALAIVLGVTFVTGTLVLGDTLNRTFDDLVGTAYQHVSFEIRGRAAFGNAAAAVNPSDRRPLPQSIATAVRRLPEVAYVYGAVAGYAQFVARDGSPIGNGGGSTLGFSFDPNPKLSSYRVVDGRAPAAADEVVMDKTTARRHHFAVGDRVRVLMPGPPQTFTVSGIVTFGNADNLVGTTLAGFTQSTAERLFNSRGHYDTIDVLSAPKADDVRLQRAIARLLPPGVEVVSGHTVANELYQAISNALSFLSRALLIFAFISLFVGGFTIFNTFSITVGQRTRELALLRVVGASRRQVFHSVLGEAAVIGLIASVIGLGLGVAAAIGLKALLKAFGIALPSAPLVFEARTPVVAIAVGVGVTALSAILPARRALRIPPVAALVEHSEDQPQSARRWRAGLGGAVAIAGSVALVAGLSAPKIALVGLGALAVFLAAAILGPIIARPLSGAIGRPVAALLGTAGTLGRKNATRNPRRTAQTAAALMLGIALVSTIAVLGASLSRSARQSVASAVRADYLITSSDGFSRSLPTLVSRLPGVATTTTGYKGRFEFRGALATITAASPVGLANTVNLHVVAGTAAPAMAAGRLLVDANTADRDHLHVGSQVRVTFAQTGPTTMRIGGIFKYNPLVGSYVTGDGFFLSHFNNPLPAVVAISTAPGTRNFEATLNHALAAYPNLDIQSRREFEHAQQASINQLLGLIYVMLALAVVIALIGIVNTLMLSVFERTHEIGLLRAVGMRRRQVRTMIRSESVIIALFGAIVGVVIGAGLGIALASALRNNGVTAMAVPFGSLIGFVILSGVLGLVAATWPARRAANLDVLSAIAAE